MIRLFTCYSFCNSIYIWTNQIVLLDNQKSKIHALYYVLFCLFLSAWVLQSVCVHTMDFVSTHKQKKQNTRLSTPPSKNILVRSYVLSASSGNFGILLKICLPKCVFCYVQALRIDCWYYHRCVGYHSYEKYVFFRLLLPTFCAVYLLNRML